MRALYDPASWHETLVLGAAGLARVAGDVGREAQALEPGAEAAVVEGAVGGKDAWMRAPRHVQVSQSGASRRQVVAVAAFYPDGKNKPGTIDDRRPRRALLAPVEP